jgi:hypothetical protein
MTRTIRNGARRIRGLDSGMVNEQTAALRESSELKGSLEHLLYEYTCIWEQASMQYIWGVKR